DGGGVGLGGGQRRRRVLGAKGDRELEGDGKGGDGSKPARARRAGGGERVEAVGGEDGRGDGEDVERARRAAQRREQRQLEQERIERAAAAAREIACDERRDEECDALASAFAREQ